MEHEHDWRYEPSSALVDHSVAVPGQLDEPSQFPMVVDPAIIARLSRQGVEVTAAYVTLMAWEMRGEEVSAERYITEVWKDDWSKLWVLESLSRHGLVITPEVAERRRGDFNQAVYGFREYPGEEVITAVRPGEQQRKPRRKPLVVPNPFPSYLAETWTGDEATWQETCPRPGRSVVYFLSDPAGRLLYIGSTGNVFGRFGAHVEKGWATYEARLCADRDAAYWLEAREIIRRDPPLNRGDSVRGRIKALRKAGVGS